MRPMSWTTIREIEASRLRESASAVGTMRPPSRQIVSARWDPAIETVLGRSVSREAREIERLSLSLSLSLCRSQFRYLETIRDSDADNRWPASPVIESGCLAAIPVVPVRLWRHRSRCLNNTSFLRFFLPRYQGAPALITHADVSRY